MEYIKNVKYTRRDSKTDAIAGGLNGILFGIVYSFYYYPIEKFDPRYIKNFRGNPFLYYSANCIKMAASFAIMRGTYNALKKQEVSNLYMGLGCGVAFGIVCLFM